MKKQLEDALVRDFPELFKRRHLSPQESAMAFGFAVGDGWEPIIRTLAEQLTQLALWEGNSPVADQVKEKFGKLRFYADGLTPIQSACVFHAEAKSSQACEKCGSWGGIYRRSSGWLGTRCEKCATKDGYIERVYS